MATADDDVNVDVDVDGAPAAPIYMQQPTTTPEAQKYSRQILDRELSGANRNGEQSLLADMGSNRDQAVAALKKAQERIQAQQYNPQLQGLGVAGALLSPTRSGSSSEGIGKAFDAIREDKLAQQKHDEALAELSSKYDLAIPGENDKLLSARLELQKIHEQQSGPLARSALTTLGKVLATQSKGQGAPLSQIGKQVTDELGAGALQTPQGQKRMHELLEASVAEAKARAGIDSSEMDPSEKQGLAQNFGVPLEAPLPWTGMSTKQKQAAMSSERTKALTELNKQDEGVDQANQVKRDLDRFMFLNKRYSTSAWQGVPGIRQVTGFSDDAKEMDKISSRLGPLMRQPGMGRMTNLDLNTFLSSTVGRDKPFAVNQSIRTAQGTAIQNQLDFNEFSHNYFAVHNTMAGAREAWDQYLNANPIFDPAAETGSFHLNPNRQSYKDYFRAKNGGVAASSAPVQMGQGASQYSDVSEADRQDPTFAGMSDDEIHASKQPAGPAMPSHARGGKIRGHADGGKVKEEDDYQATLADLARSLEQGASFHWGDEANAGLTPGPYAQNVEQERGKQERYGASHPWANTGLEMAGGAASGLAVNRVAGALMDKAKGKAGALAALANLASKYAPKKFLPKSAAIGAGAGVVAGAGSAQDMDSMPGQAAQQGAIGSILGPLSGLVSKYGVNGAMGLVDKMRGNAIPGGAKKVLDALAADQDTAAEVQARLARAQRIGAPSMMADVGGPNVQALARGVATKPGPQVGQFVGQLADRQGQSNERVQDLVNKALKPDDYSTKLTELTTNLYQNAKPLYQQAYSQYPKIKSQVLQDILNTPSGGKAAKAAFKMMQDAGEPIGKADVSGMVRKPSLQYLDYVKRSLDDIVDKSERAGNMNQARIVRTMRNKLRDELDTATTDPSGGPSAYAQARGQYAGDLEVLDALKMGRDDFSKMSARDLGQQVDKMSFAEKDALRTGVAENLFQQISATPGTANSAAKLANVPAMQSKLQTLFDSPKEYTNFMDALKQEMTNFNQSRQIISTAASSRAAAASSSLDPTGHLGEAAYEGVLGAAGHPLWAGARAAKFLGNKMMPSGTAEQAADILALPSSGGATTRAALGKLGQQGQQAQDRISLADMAGLTGAGAASNAVSPDPWGNLDTQGVQ